MKKEFTTTDSSVVKGVAILCLLFYHLFEHAERVTTMQVDYRPFSLDSFLLFSSFGNICVAIFVFLSAYGIAKGIRDKEQAGEQITLTQMFAMSCVRYIKLTANFLAMFISVNLLWFSKFDYVGLYGRGWQGGLYTLLDATGLSGLFKTFTINQTWWYMELAIVIVFIAPLLYLAIKKLGYYALPLAVLLPVMVDLTFDIKRYYFVMVFGVAAVVLGWFEKSFSMKCPVFIQVIVGILLLIGSVFFRQNYVVYTEFAYLVDAPIAFLVAWFGAAMLAPLPIIGKALGFLGKHSMNIYFVHTFFYMAIYQKFIYSFKYAGLIFIVLLGVCLIYSLVLEGIKRLCGFQKLMKYIRSKAEGGFAK